MVSSQVIFTRNSGCMNTELSHSIFCFNRNETVILTEENGEHTSGPSPLTALIQREQKLRIYGVKGQWQICHEKP